MSNLFVYINIVKNCSELHVKFEMDLS